MPGRVARAGARRGSRRRRRPPRPCRRSCTGPPSQQLQQPRVDRAGRGAAAGSRRRSSEPAVALGVARARRDGRRPARRRPGAAPRWSTWAWPSTTRLIPPSALGGGGDRAAPSRDAGVEHRDPAALVLDQVDVHRPRDAAAHAARRRRRPAPRRCRRAAAAPRVLRVEGAAACAARRVEPCGGSRPIWRASAEAVGEGVVAHDQPVARPAAGRGRSSVDARAGRLDALERAGPGERAGRRPVHGDAVVLGDDGLDAEARSRGTRRTARRSRRARRRGRRRLDLADDVLDAVGRPARGRGVEVARRRARRSTSVTTDLCVGGHAARRYRPAPCASPPDGREVGRGERVLPGVWRLRLPLPWPGVPHCNAWALAAGDGIVLVDTGMHEPRLAARTSSARSSRSACGSRTSACSSARTPTSTTAARRAPIAERAGCELWMHPRHEHLTARRRRPRGGARAADRDRAPERRAGGAAAALGGAPARPGSGMRGPLRARPRPGRRASRSRPTSAPGRCIETPGHAPSHVVPAPARAAAADLRRPPARPHLALLRLRLHARPGRRVPAPRSTSSTRSTRGSRCAGHGAAVHRRRAATSRPTARSSRERLDARPRRARRTARRPPSSSLPRVYGERVRRRPTRELAADARLLCYLTHLEARGRGRARGRASRERWAAA